MNTNSLLLQIKQKIPSYDALHFLDCDVEINGTFTSVSNHISTYIQHLNSKEKLSIIMKGLNQNIEIDPLTFQFESINVVCEDVIVGLLTR